MKSAYKAGKKTKPIIYSGQDRIPKSLLNNPPCLKIVGVPELKQKQGQEQKRQDARILLPAVGSILSTQQPQRMDWDTQCTHLLPSLPVFAALISATPCSGAPFHSDFTSPKQELVTDVFSLPCHLTLHEFQLDQEGQVHHWHLWDPVRRTKKKKNKLQLTVPGNPACLDTPKVHQPP